MRIRMDDIIKKRKTQKVLADKPWPVDQDREGLKKMINELLDLAGHAPYHKKCHERYSEVENDLDSCVPWRFHVLDAQNCRTLYHYIARQNTKAGKISNMLAAADALFLVTWLPDPPEATVTDEEDKMQVEESLPFVGNIRNMEHIAAASTAIQNVLIGATARNIPNYWSSGGQLRNLALRQYLNISLQEILMGAVFLFPEDAENRNNVMIKSGAMRDQGKEKSTWSRWLQLEIEKQV